MNINVSLTPWGKAYLQTLDILNYLYIVFYGSPAAKFSWVNLHTFIQLASFNCSYLINHFNPRLFRG